MPGGRPSMVVSLSAFVYRPISSISLLTVATAATLMLSGVLLGSG